MTLNVPAALSRSFQGLCCSACWRQMYWLTTGSESEHDFKATIPMNHLLVPLLDGTLIAATPLIFAAIGELITERSVC